MWKFHFSSNLIFVGYTGSKNPVWTGKKFQLVLKSNFISVWNKCPNGYFKKPVQINRGTVFINHDFLLELFLEHFIFWKSIFLNIMPNYWRTVSGGWIHKVQWFSLSTYVDFCKKSCFLGPKQLVRGKVNVH